MNVDNIVVEFPKGRILVNAKKERTRAYAWATACALEFGGLVRAATADELKEKGWESI